MPRILVSAVLLSLSAAAFSTASAEPSEKIKVELPPPVERIWQHWGNKVGEFRGTFVQIENLNTAVIRDPNGKMLRVPLYYFSAPDLSYMLNRLAKFPEYVDRKPLAAGEHCLVDLRAKDLPVGKLTQWPNQGELGGSFWSMNHPPVVEEVLGRKGVKFDYNAYYIDPTFTAMTADVLAPRSLDPGKPFTLTAWVYHPNAYDADDPETLLSFQVIGGDNGTSISYTGDSVHGFTHVAGFGTFRAGAEGISRKRWQHVAYVYTGGVDGEYRIYVDGKLAGTRKCDNLIELGGPTDITQTSAVVNGRLHVLEGDKAQVVAYVGKEDHHYWFQMRHWHWDQMGDAGWFKDGKVSHRFDGLEPGTRYYYRMLSMPDTHTGDWWSYTYLDRRWANGVGSFVTAGKDGTPGKVLPNDNRRHLFVGANWGSRWYMAYPGPSGWFKGYISELRLFDRAFDELAVRADIGKSEAFAPSPAKGARLARLEADLSWRSGAKAAARFRVHLGTAREKVAGDEAVLIETAEPTVKDVALKEGRQYFWRVEQLDAAGEAISPGEVWTFKAVKGEACDPDPADGATINLTGGFTWRPGSTKVKGQRFFLADSREAVARAAEPVAAVRRSRYRMPTDLLTPGKTYYWRIESTQEDGAVTPGDIWSFTVRDYVTPEFDGPAPEPYPDNLTPGRPGAKILTGWGHPTITTPGADDDLLRVITAATHKYLRKSPVLREYLASVPCGTRLGSFEGSGWESGFACGSYGGVSGARGPHFLLMHEMGHQIFMHGFMRITDDFLGRTLAAFDNHKINNAWLGDYGSNNIHEMMADTCKHWTEAPGREMIYRGDRAWYLLLKQYLPGDTHIELHPAHGLACDADGTVKSWANNAGLEVWKPYGYVHLPGSSGRFNAVGSPRRETVAGATAVRLTGRDALKWNCKTMYGLDGYRAWSVEMWVRRDAGPAGGPETLVAWGPADRGVRVRAGAELTDGRWHHVAHVFEGGGHENGPRACRVYVDGKLRRQSEKRFDIPPNVPVHIGGIVGADGKVADGFRGAIGLLRVHNYDISADQVREHYAGQAPYYRDDGLHVAGSLYVDLDARRLAEVGDEHHQPLYPKSLRKGWLRSWANAGTLAGRVHNDVAHPVWGHSGSTPIFTDTTGAAAPYFVQKDRMVGMFGPDAEMLANGPGTLEAWVCKYGLRDDDVVLEWGAFRLEGRHLKRGWQHVGVTFTGDTPPGPRRGGKHDPVGTSTIYVNGVKVAQFPGALRPRAGQRLHVGAHYDPVRWNWKNYFFGAIAAIRVHKGTLTAEQLAANARRDYLALPHRPTPADGSLVVVARRPALSWAPSKLGGEEAQTILLGGTRDSLKPVGRFTPGQCRPALEPGQRYYWRVGNGPVWSFRTRQGVMIDLKAKALPAGKAGKWTNTGRAGGAFVPGTRGDIDGVPIETFKGVKCLSLTTGKGLAATFKTPEALRKGPFSLYVHAALPSRLWAGQVVGWGGGTGKVSLLMGVHSRREHAALVVGQGDESAVKVRWPGLNSTMAYFWKKVVLTYDGKTITLYLDGRQIAQEKNVAMGIADLGTLVIGKATGRRSEILLNELCLFPSVLSAEEVAALSTGTLVGAGNALVHVSVNSLEAGQRITSLRNLGSAGGAFAAPADGDHAPTVADVAGRKAVQFDGRATFMTSTVPTPAVLARDKPFTIEMLVHSRDAGRGAIFTLAPRVGVVGKGAQGYLRRGAWFCYGGVEDNALALGRDAPGVMPPVMWRLSPGEDPKGKWTHVAYVYEGGPRADFRVYVDGELNHEQPYHSMATIPGYSMYLGALFHTNGAGESNLFRGALATLTAYDYARTNKEIAQAAKAAP